MDFNFKEIAILPSLFQINMALLEFSCNMDQSISRCDIHKFNQMDNFVLELCYINLPLYFEFLCIFEHDGTL